MKKPNPIFLGVIALVALLPHTPRLLPGSMSGSQDTAAQTLPLNDNQSEKVAEMPTAELPPASGDGTECANFGSGYEKKDGLYPEPGADEKLPDSPSIDTGENCDTGWHPSQQNFLSVHLASTHL